MRPGSLSALGARLAVSGLSPAARGVLLSLAVASDADGVAHVSAGRLAERTGYSVGHVKRLLRELGQAGFVEAFAVPGRANRWHVIEPETEPSAEAGSAPTERAGAPGVVRGRASGGAPARPVSGCSSESSSTARPDRPTGGRSARTDPTPATPYRFDPGGPTRSLRDYLGGRSIAEAVAAHAGGSTDANSTQAPVPAVGERVLAVREGSGDPIAGVPCVA